MRQTSRSAALLAWLVAVFLGGAVGAPTCAAQGATPAAAPATFRLPRLVEGTLRNGLHVIVCPRDSAGLVDVRVAVRAGTWLEGEQEGSGISHYFEHLLIGGTTEQRTEKESKRLLRQIGGIHNAVTDADRTWFYITTTSDGVRTAVDLLADWVQNCSLAEAEVEREKQVILDELDLYADQDPRVAWELVHALAFTRHPARLPLQGYRERFEAITRDDLAGFFERSYVPSNAVVAVVGDVDPGEAYNIVRQAFAGWSGERVSEPRFSREPEQNGRRAAHRKGTGRQTSVVLGYRTVALDHPDMYALDVLATILGSGTSSRLNRRLVDADGLTHSVRVLSRTPTLGGGLFTIMSQCQPDQVGLLEQAVTAEIQEIAERGVLAADVGGAVRRMVADTVFGLEQVEDLSQALTRDYLQSGDCRYTEGYLERLAAVTGADVQRVAAHYLVPARLSVALVGPDPTGEPEAASPNHSEPAAIRSVTLDNGVRILLRPTPGRGVAAVHLAAAGGSMAEQTTDNGASAILADLLLRGADPQGRKAALRGRIEALGGSVSSRSDRWSVGLTVRSLADDLPLAFSFLQSALEPLALDAAGFDRARSRVRSRVARRMAGFSGDGEDRLYAALFAGSPVALPARGSLESLEQLQPDQVKALAERLLVGGNLVLSVVGDFDPDAIEALLRARFGRLGRGAAIDVRARGAEVQARGRTLLDETRRSQATVMLAWPGRGVEQAEERVALDLIDAWISGRRTASGPLFEALRGDEADLAYHVYGSHRPQPGTGLFYILAQCAPEKSVEVVNALRQAVTLLVRDGMQEEELETARNILLASRESATQSVASRARVLATTVIFGLPVDAGSRYRETVARTTVEQVNQVARAVFEDPGRLLVLLPRGSDEAMKTQLLALSLAMVGAPATVAEPFTPQEVTRLALDPDGMSLAELEQAFGENRLQPDPAGLGPPPGVEDDAVLHRWYGSAPGMLNGLLNNDGNLQDSLLCYLTLGAGVRHRDSPSRFAPGVADYASLSEDGRSVLVRLRRGIRWQLPVFDRDDPKYAWIGELFRDGAPELTARDFAFTHDLIMDEDTDAAWIRGAMEGSSVEVVSRYAFRVHWDRLYIYAFNDSVSWPQVLPEFLYSRDESGGKIARDALPEAFSSHWYNSRMCGYGPYEFVRFDPGIEIVIRRKEDFPVFRPAIRQIHWQITSDAEITALRMLDGALDHIALEPAQYRKYLQNANPGEGFRDERFSVQPYDKMELFFLGWNGRRPPFDDSRVRRAMGLAFNRTAILRDVFHGMGGLSDSHVFHRHPYFNADIEGLPFDLDSASRLLDEAGWGDANGDGVRDKRVRSDDGEEARVDLDFSIITFAGSEGFKSILAIYREDLLKIGVRMRSEPLPWPQMQQRVYKDRDFDSFTGNLALGWDVDLYEAYHSDGSSNYGGYSNLEVDRLLEAFRGTLSDETRRRQIFRVQEILHDEQRRTYFMRRIRMSVYASNLKNVHYAIARPQLRSFGWYHSD